MISRSAKIGVKSINCYPKIVSLSLLFFMVGFFNSLISNALEEKFEGNEIVEVDIANNCLNKNGTFAYPCIVQVSERAGVVQIINNGSEITIDSNFEIKGIKYWGNVNQTSELQFSNLEGSDVIFTEVSIRGIDPNMENQEFQRHWMQIKGIRKVILLTTNLTAQEKVPTIHVSGIILNIQGDQTQSMKDLNSVALLIQYRNVMDSLNKCESNVKKSDRLRFQRLTESLGQGILLMTPKSGATISIIHHKVIENLRRTLVLLLGFAKTHSYSDSSELCLKEFSNLKRFKENIQFLTGWNELSILQGSKTFTALSAAIYDQLFILNSYVSNIGGIKPQVLNELMSSTLKFGNIAKSSAGGDARAVESVRSFAILWNSLEWQRTLEFLVGDQRTPVNEIKKVGLNLFNLVNELSVLSGVAFEMPHIQTTTVSNQIN